MFRELLGGTKQETVGEPSQPHPKGASVPPTVDTVVGTGAHFEGNLKTEGNVRVHGTFIGDIDAQGKVADRKSVV